MQCLGAGGSAVKFANVNKGITTLAININLNSYTEDTKNKIEHYKHYNHFNHFKGLKSADRVSCIKKRKNYR